MAQLDRWAAPRLHAGYLQLTSNTAFEPPEEPAVSGRRMDGTINAGDVYTHLVQDLRGRDLLHTGVCARAPQ